jgi:hypothetical protein
MIVWGRTTLRRSMSVIHVFQLGQPPAITLLDQDRLELIDTSAFDHGLSLRLIA